MRYLAANLRSPMTNQTTLDELVRAAPPAASAGDLTGHRRPLKALTGIRFFAALYVILFHSRVSAALADHGLRIAGLFLANGYLAVPLFFLLSGFILAYTYTGQASGRSDRRRFWEARFSRIWPVYAFSLALASLATRALPHWGVALATLLMVQAWNPRDIGMAGAWNMPCWTLSCEALFYLCFPWIQSALEKHGKGVMLGVTAAMLGLCVALNCGLSTLGFSPPGLIHNAVLPLVHLPEFLTGVGLGNVFLALRRDRESFLPGRGAWTYLWAVASIALLCVPAGRATSLVEIAFCGLIVGLAAERTALSRVLSTKLALLGGGMSYSMYLLQMPAKPIAIGLAERLGVTSSWTRLGMTMALLLAISWIAFRAIEEPARKGLRSIFAGFEDKRSRVPETVGSD